MDSPYRVIIKINMDESFYNDGTYSGIGSVCRNHASRILLHFGNHIIAESAIHAKILEIREDFLIASTSHWANSTSFFVEFDFHNVVAWFLDPSSGP